jgi:NADH:ubiquinone oxidoreductase subunit 5 (subunit L)/multisubunit Na+/H+ antiporter MnhA subunit
MYLGYTGQTEELSIVVWPFITFALAAFGFKQPPVEGFFSKERMELWMLILRALAGSKVVLIVVTALVAGLISYFTIQYIQSAERGKLQLELQELQNTKRKVIRDAIKDTPNANPNDATDSLQYFRDRNKK